MTGRKQSLALIALLSCLTGPAQGETPPKMDFEFIDQKYGDIFFALSAWSGISIVADDTVTGKASFQYAGANFEGAFDAFLRANRLAVAKTPTTWVVGKILVSRVEEKITVEAYDSTAARILEKISRETATPIIFDTLPSTPLSGHYSEIRVLDLIAMVIRPFADYAIEESGSGFCVKKNVSSPSRVEQNRFTVRRVEGLYDVSVTQAKLSEVIADLCGQEGRAVSNFAHADPTVRGIAFSGKNFAESLRLILEQAGAESVERGGVLYVLPDALKDPAQGVRERDFSWSSLELCTIRQSDASRLLQARYPAIRLIPNPDGCSFFVYADGPETEGIREYLRQIDFSPEVTVIKLRYISFAELLKNPPPSAKKEEIVDVGTGEAFFYTGPEFLRERIIGEMAEIDRPKTRIQYDLLIIQYDETADLSFGSSVNMRNLQAGDQNILVGNFGNLLSLNFDVVTLFGYRFSTLLNAAIAENRARVFTDTTLHGISGETIKFQNTSTYRYRDSNVDPDTGKPIYTGITREIISGVIIDIGGWVSGDGMVTMNVTATVSKRGADVTEENGNPPPTSERSVSTRINAANGEPVVLSGLRQNDDAIVDQRTPFLSKIPILGYAFRGRSKTTTRGEMVIYLVPHVTNGESPKEVRRRLAATAYERLAKPLLGGNAD